MWKKLAHTNIVQLREVFTTKAFGDSCKYLLIVCSLIFVCTNISCLILFICSTAIIFVYDYHPASETLLNKHFSSTELNGYTDPFSQDPNVPRPYSHTKNTILRHQHNSMLPESIIWSYIIQLTAALRVIHAAGKRLYLTTDLSVECNKRYKYL